MRRRLSNALAVLSLVPCVATVVLWVRSQWYADTFGREYPESPDRWQRGGHVASVAGTIRCEWWLRQNEPHAQRPNIDWTHTSWRLRSVPILSWSPLYEGTWYGFDYSAYTYDNARPRSDGRPAPPLMSYVHRIYVPHWFVLIILLCVPAAWLLRAVRRQRALRRAAQMLCPSCGYDLRATPERCPECGAVPNQIVT